MNNSIKPKITIVTPSFNQGAFIEKTIKSVLDQNYSNLEYIIIDGGSTDETVEIIKKYEDKINCWISEKDNGQSNAINKGFAKATGEIYAWLNSDDILLPGALDKVAEVAMSNPHYGAYVGKRQRRAIDGTYIGVTIPNDMTTKGLLEHNAHIGQSACFFRSDIFKQVDGVDETLHFPMDFDLWLKISQVSKFKAIDYVLAEDLEHPDAKSVAPKYVIQSETERILVTARFGEDYAREEIEGLVKFYHRIRRMPLYIILRKLYKIFTRG